MAPFSPLRVLSRLEVVRKIYTEASWTVQKVDITLTGFCLYLEKEDRRLYIDYIDGGEIYITETEDRDMIFLPSVFGNVYKGIIQNLDESRIIKRYAYKKNDSYFLNKIIVDY